MAAKVTSYTYFFVLFSGVVGFRLSTPEWCEDSWGGRSFIIYNYKALSLANMMLTTRVTVRLTIDLNPDILPERESVASDSRTHIHLHALSYLWFHSFKKGFIWTGVLVPQLNAGYIETGDNALFAQCVIGQLYLSSGCAPAKPDWVLWVDAVTVVRCDEKLWGLRDYISCLRMVLRSTQRHLEMEALFPKHSPAFTSLRASYTTRYGEDKFTHYPTAQQSFFNRSRVSTLTRVWSNLAK